MKILRNISLFLSSGGVEREFAFASDGVNHIVLSSRCVSSGLFRALNLEVLSSF